MLNDLRDLLPKTKRDTLKGFLRIKAGDRKKIRNALYKQQDKICPLCQRDMSYLRPAQRCLDHDHAATGPSAGAIRGVLCKNCNGNEGRIRRRVLSSMGSLTEIEFLKNLVEYWELHSTNQTGLIHDTYKTPAEARAYRNKKARERYHKKKGIK
jgi:hypothetical protein